MITSIVFSKNRPLQLDLCLSSIKKNLPECSQTIVIYKNSEDFIAAHETLEREHPDVQFWPQDLSLFRDTYQAAISADNDYINFLTDDDIVFMNIPVDYSLLKDSDIACLSLRMGLNVCYRGHGNSIQTEDQLDAYLNMAHLATFGGDVNKLSAIHDDMLLWKRTVKPYGSYWSYSLSLDGHVFDGPSIVEMLDELCYLEERYSSRWKQTPNELEGALQRFWTTTPDFMISPKHSRVVNSPNNKVQDTHNLNVSGEHHACDEKYLLGKYLNGSRINVDYLDFGNIGCPHTEIDILEGIV